MTPEQWGVLMRELGELKTGQEKVCAEVKRLTSRVDKLDDRVWDERSSRTDIDAKQAERIQAAALEAREARVRTAALGAASGLGGAAILEALVKGAAKLFGG